MTYESQEQTFRFSQLFAGREDVHGHDEGRCVEGRPDFHAHLHGGNRIGVYPLRDDGYVRWGCIDIDFDDVNLAKNLRGALAALDIKAFIETSRSKGYHVWVFATWGPARVMRDALMAACQICDYNPKEVNPKQVTTDGLVRGYGNYVRLPYGRGRPPGRQEMLGCNFAGFVTEAWATINPPDVLQAAAALYVPPPPPIPIVRDVDATADRSQLNALGRHVLQNGPLEGRQDRSTALMVLAHQCRESQLSRSEALAIVAEGDERWGKFYGRPDAVQRLEDVVRRAYGG